MINAHELNESNDSSIIGDESFVESEFGVDKKFRKVLGVNWDVDSDEFVFDFDQIVELAMSLSITKRNILRVGASFFDPVGYISPIILKAKLCFQKCCLESLGWDEEVPDSIKKEWKSFLKELKVISSIRIPRFMSSSNVIRSF